MGDFDIDHERKMADAVTHVDTGYTIRGVPIFVGVPVGTVPRVLPGVQQSLAYLAWTNASGIEAIEDNGDAETQGEELSEERLREAVAEHDFQAPVENPIQDDMLRDMFASSALVALASFSPEPDTVAKRCYGLADAMLRQRVANPSSTS